MNKPSGTESGGASIKPSARPSIHRHRGDCVFLPGEKTDFMAKYGEHEDSSDDELQANSTNEGRARSHANSIGDTGRDEPDNVLSKMQKQPSPLNARRIIQKRNSFDSFPPSLEDSDSSFKHAKSLPTYLRSTHSLSSDEVGNWFSPNQSNTSMESFRRNTSNQLSAANTNYSFSSSPNRSQNRGHYSAKGENKSLLKITLALLISMVIAFLAIYYQHMGPSSIQLFSASQSYNKARFYDDLNDLNVKYRIGDDSIMKLQTGISTIFKRQDTGSFVFAYKSDKENFNQDTFNSLINTIASSAAKYLRNESMSVQHIVVDGSNLEMRSHSELISKYREDFSKTGVMLVREVDEVPSALAMAFHYYCDEYNPLAKRSAIFFTLDMTKCSANPSEQNPDYAQIEKCLKKKWSGVPKDNIGPLVNRVVSTIIDVPEKL